MKDYQINFLKLALDSGAFKLGTFTLKSGRQSPYFFNASALIEHGSLNELAEILVQKIEDSGLKFDMIFKNGPKEYISWFIELANKRAKFKKNS